MAGKNFESLKGKELDYRILEELPIMCLEGNTSTRGYVEQYLKDQDVVLHPEFELATSDMLIQFAAKKSRRRKCGKGFRRAENQRGNALSVKV